MCCTCNRAAVTSKGDTACSPVFISPSKAYLGATSSAIRSSAGLASPRISREEAEATTWSPFLPLPR